MPLDYNPYTMIFFVLLLIGTLYFKIRQATGGGGPRTTGSDKLQPLDDETAHEAEDFLGGALETSQKADKARKEAFDRQIQELQKKESR